MFVNITGVNAIMADNYTTEQTAELVAAYTAETTDEGRDSVLSTYAEKFAKSIPSLRQKLVREEVYVAKAKPTKKGGVKKADLANAIGAVAQMSESETTSLEKVTLTGLTKLWKLVREASKEVGPDASTD